MAVEWRLRVVQVPDLEAFQSERAVELCDHTVEVVHDVVTGGVDVTGIDAHADACAQWRGECVDQCCEFLEGRTECAAGAGGGLHAENRVTGFTLERLRDRGGVARQPGITIVHVVAGMRYEIVNAECVTAAEFVREAVERSCAQRVIGRRKVDQVAVVCDGDR